MGCHLVVFMSESPVSKPSTKGIVTIQRFVEQANFSAFRKYVSASGKSKVVACRDRGRQQYKNQFQTPAVTYIRYTGKERVFR
jgi:hypothetical protein